MRFYQSIPLATLPMIALSYRLVEFKLRSNLTHKRSAQEAPSVGESGYSIAPHGSDVRVGIWQSFASRLGKAAFPEISNRTNDLGRRFCA